MLSSMQLAELKNKFQAQSAELNTLRGQVENESVAFLHAYMSLLI